MPKFYLKLIKAIISCVSFIIILSSINILEFNNITINAASTSQCKASSTSSSQCTLDTIPPIKSNSVSSIIKINNSVSSQSNSIESLKTKNSELCTNDNPISTSSLNSKINFQSKSTSDINSSLTKNSCKPCTNEFPKEKNTKGLSVYSQTDFSDLRFYTSNCKYDTFNLNTKNGYDSLNNFCRKRGLEGEANAEICNFIEFAPYIEKQKQPDLKIHHKLAKKV
jgi:hypothetical protein